VARKGINAQKPDCGDGVHRNSYPHAVHGGELHGYVEVLNPERGRLERDSNDLPDAVRLGIHPDVAKQQSLFLAFGNDVQHVLWNNAKVLLAQKDEVIVGSADVSLVTFLSINYFLLQNGGYDFFTFGLPCASVIVNVLVSGGEKRLWAVTSEMGFGSSAWNTLYSRVTS
jgi:hypothetical protein